MSNTAVTVISGTFYLGMGDKIDAAAAQPLKAGGFHYLPPKEHHFAFSKAASVVQLNGEGPFDITYINAADDPQKAARIIEKPRVLARFSLSPDGERYRAPTDDVPYICRSRSPSTSW